MHNAAQDMLNKLDQTKKAVAPIDELWHEMEAFSALTGIHAFDNVPLDQVLQAARDRVKALKNNQSVVLDDFELMIGDKVYTISLIDAVLCNAALAKNMFEDHIKKGEISQDKRKIVDLQLECIQKINEILRQTGLKQHLSAEDIVIHYKGIIGAIGMQTVHYKESAQK